VVIVPLVANVFDVVQPTTHKTQTVTAELIETTWALLLAAVRQKARHCYPEVYFTRGIPLRMSEMVFEVIKLRLEKGQLCHKAYLQIPAKEDGETEDEREAYLIVRVSLYPDSLCWLCHKVH
jgi:hypothetical protein